MDNDEDLSEFDKQCASLESELLGAERDFNGDDLIADETLEEAIGLYQPTYTLRELDLKTETDKKVKLEEIVYHGAQSLIVAGDMEGEKVVVKLVDLDSDFQEYQFANELEFFKKINERKEKMSPACDERLAIDSLFVIPEYTLFIEDDTGNRYVGYITEECCELNPEGVKFSKLNLERSFFDGYRIALSMIKSSLILQEEKLIEYDFKPDNFLVKGGLPARIDFGLTVNEWEEIYGGTPNYMSAKQFLSMSEGYEDILFRHVLAVVSALGGGYFSPIGDDYRHINFDRVRGSNRDFKRRVAHRLLSKIKPDEEMELYSQFVGLGSIEIFSGPDEGFSIPFPYQGQGIKNICRTNSPGLLGATKKAIPFEFKESDEPILFSKRTYVPGSLQEIIKGSIKKRKDFYALDTFYKDMFFQLKNSVRNTLGLISRIGNRVLDDAKKIKEKSYYDFVDFFDLVQNNLRMIDEEDHFNDFSNFQVAQRLIQMGEDVALYLGRNSEINQTILDQVKKTYAYFRMNPKKTMRRFKRLLDVRGGNTIFYLADEIVDLQKKGFKRSFRKSFEYDAMRKNLSRKNKFRSSGSNLDGKVRLYMPKKFNLKSPPKKTESNSKYCNVEQYRKKWIYGNSLERSEKKLLAEIEFQEKKYFAMLDGEKNYRPGKRLSKNESKFYKQKYREQLHLDDNLETMDKKVEITTEQRYERVCKLKELFEVHLEKRKREYGKIKALRSIYGKEFNPFLLGKEGFKECYSGLSKAYREKSLDKIKVGRTIKNRFLNSLPRVNSEQFLRRSGYSWKKKGDKVVFRKGEEDIYLAKRVNGRIQYAGYSVQNDQEKTYKHLIKVAKQLI